MRCFEPSLFVPFSRFLLDDDFADETVVDVVDSALFVVIAFTVVRLERLAFDDKDETFELRGRLSIEDCDEAVQEKCKLTC